jgi:nucleoside-diphosphate-sugar epimerase
VLLNFSNSPSKNTYISQVINTNSPTLVIGGGGYIGSVLVEEMVRKGMNVRVFDKFIYGKEVFDDIVSSENLEIIEGDATDIYALTLALRNVKAVVHLAGIVGDPASMVDDRLTRHMNIISTRMIKEEVKGLRIPKFIFASSCSVYGASDKMVGENSPLNPLSPYAKSKIDSEKELLQDTFDEFHPTILRFATVFGHSRKPRFDLVANLFVAQAFTHGTITVTGENQWRPFIHTSDVARSMMMMLDAPQRLTSRQIFNVGDDNMHMTIGELAKSVQRVMSPFKKVRIIVRNNDADMRNYKVSFRKINNLFDFKCQATIEEGLKEMLEHFRKGTYIKPYTDVYYSALETTKEIKKEFYSESYRRTHFSDLALPDLKD